MMIKMYQVEYRNSKVAYTAETLDKHMFEHGVPVLEEDRDYLTAAVKWYCYTHFMSSGPSSIHLNQCDAETRGGRLQEWQYQPYGVFRGWIYARVIDR